MKSSVLDLVLLGPQDMLLGATGASAREEGLSNHL